MQPQKDSAMYFLVIFTVMFTLMYGIYCQVFCEIESDPAVFGRPINILCRKLNTSSGCVRNDIRKWMGGEHLDALMLNGRHSDQRYTEQIRSCSDFILRISNLTERDLNHQYCCSVGFDDCRLSLSLSSGNFEYHPSIESIESNITLSSKFVSFSVYIPKVYPDPNCTVVYGDETLNQPLIQNSSHDDQFFSTELHLNYTFPSEKCPIVVNVTCLIGSTSFLILHKEFQNCSDNDAIGRSLGWSWFFVACISLLVVGSMILVFCSLFRHKTEIVHMLPDLCERKCTDWRRPVLGVAITVVLFSFLIYLEIRTISNVQRIQEQHKDIVAVVTMCILMTPMSLCCISNPDTISIRQGTKKSCERFIMKFKSGKRNGPSDDNNTEGEKNNQVEIPLVNKDRNANAPDIREDAFLPSL